MGDELIYVELRGRIFVRLDRGERDAETIEQSARHFLSEIGLEGLHFEDLEVVRVRRRED